MAMTGKWDQMGFTPSYEAMSGSADRHMEDHRMTLEVLGRTPGGAGERTPSTHRDWLGECWRPVARALSIRPFGQPQ